MTSISLKNLNFFIFHRPNLSWFSVACGGENTRASAAAPVVALLLSGAFEAWPEARPRPSAVEMSHPGCGQRGANGGSTSAFFLLQQFRETAGWRAAEGGP